MESASLIYTLVFVILFVIVLIMAIAAMIKKRNGQGVFFKDGYTGLHILFAIFNPFLEFFLALIDLLTPVGNQTSSS